VEPATTLSAPFILQARKSNKEIVIRRQNCAIAFFPAGGNFFTPALSDTPNLRRLIERSRRLIDTTPSHRPHTC
jgi:hypothetical protein